MKGKIIVEECVAKACTSEFILTVYRLSIARLAEHGRRANQAFSCAQCSDNANLGTFRGWRTRQSASLLLLLQYSWKRQWWTFLAG